MAKIGKLAVSLFGETAEIELRYTTKDNFFAVYPDSITRIIGLPKNDFETRKALEAQVCDWVAKANATVEVVEYLIYYETKSGENDQNFPAIQLEWVPLKKRTYGENVIYYVISKNPFYGHDFFGAQDKPDELGIPGWQVLANTYSRGSWRDKGLNPQYCKYVACTPENLEFFENATEAIRALRDKIKEFIDQPDLQAVIAEGTQKLLG